MVHHIKNKMIKFPLFIIFILTGFLCIAQNQQVTDSLIFQYRSGSNQDELDLLSKIAANETNHEKSLQYAESLITKAAEDSIFESLYKGYLYKGNALLKMGKNVEALSSFYLSQKFAIRTDKSNRIGISMSAIAGAYSAMENYDNAEEYYLESVELLEKGKDSIDLANTLMKLAILYITLEKLDLALKKTNVAADIFKIKNSPVGSAKCLGNRGMIYAKQGRNELAEANINEAIKILDELNDYSSITVYLASMSDIYLNKGQWDQALAYSKRSLELAIKYDLKEQMAAAHLKLSKLYEIAGDFEESNRYLKNYYAYRESILDIEAVREIGDIRRNFEMSQKQAELDLLQHKQDKQRIIFFASLIALILIALLALGLFHRNYYIRKTSHIIEKERDRSDDLLCNILPEQTAHELKEIGKVKAKRFESVTVMFTDFKAFTANSDKLSPEELVESVDFYFSEFDRIMEKYGLEKIKTIGDAYMCAGGIPFPTPDHAIKSVEAAFEIAEFVYRSKTEDPNNLTRFDIRIGINTGPVVAGVVGTKKFAYDIWGDTVNIASRMESNSETGKINISENTYQLIKDEFCCTYRGEIPAKYKGNLKMYYVNARFDESNEKRAEKDINKLIRMKNIS